MIIRFQILCSTKEPTWVPVDIKNRKTFENENLVQGGFEIGHKLFIGRINYQGLTVTGKVFLDSVNRGLEIMIEGHHAKKIQCFEMLTFK